MGYHTHFDGKINIEPPLNEHEIEYLTQFSQSRRMERNNGPYFIGRGEADVISQNRPPQGQPGLWCQWVPTPDGSALEWDQGEKFYSADEWMKYLIDHFLAPGAKASRTNDLQFADFTFDHVLNGEIEAQGEEAEDRWALTVENNKVYVTQAMFIYGTRTPVQ